MEVWGGGQGRQGRDSSDSFLAVLATPCTAGAQAAGETLGVCVTHISSSHTGVRELGYLHSSSPHQRGRLLGKAGHTNPPAHLPCHTVGNAARPRLILQESGPGETAGSQQLCAKVGVSRQGIRTGCWRRWLCHPIHQSPMLGGHQNEKYAGVAFYPGAAMTGKLTVSPTSALRRLWPQESGLESRRLAKCLQAGTTGPLENFADVLNNIIAFEKSKTLGILPT